jgi:hypothetical protein
MAQRAHGIWSLVEVLSARRGKTLGALLLEMQRLDPHGAGASRDRERQLAVDMRLQKGKVKKSWK